MEPIAEPVEGKVIRGPSIVEDERVEGQGRQARADALLFVAPC